MRIVPCHSTAPALALLLGVAAVSTPHGAAPLQEGRARTVAVADIHGSISGLTTILREAGLIDAAGQWSGGRARLVQTGDFLDRGRDVRAVMDLLMRLETDARRAGGRVDVLFGNHEGMNILHDLRDVSPEAYATFVDGRSEDRRRRAFDAHAAIARRAGRALDRDVWMQAHPPGFVEYVEALRPSGRYGRWLRSRPVAIEVDGTLFMHAGLVPDSRASLEEVNRSVEREIRTWDAVVSELERQRLVTRTFRVNDILSAAQEEIARILEAQTSGGPIGDHVTREFAARLQHIAEIDSWALVAGDGPLWYRGFATLPEAAQPAIDRLLLRLGAERVVVGHTPQLPGSVTPRFAGRVILADTGMLASHYRGGRPSAVEIQDGRVTAIYPGVREPLPEPATAPR